jgi:hypothetical protein
MGYTLYHCSNPDIKAETIAKAYCPDSERMIVRRIYFGRSLMDDTPLPIEEEIGIWRNINIEKGDALILVGMPKTSE